MVAIDPSNTLGKPLVMADSTLLTNHSLKMEGTIGEGQVRREGKLSKYTNFFRGWQSRHVVLEADGEGTWLKYALTRDEAMAGAFRGKVLVEQALTLANDDDVLRFDVTQGAESMQLRAESLAERDEWVGMLQRIRGRGDALAQLQKEETLRQRGQEEDSSPEGLAVDHLSLVDEKKANSEAADDWEFMPDMQEVVAPRNDGVLEFKFVVSAERSNMFLLTCVESAKETGAVLNTYTVTAKLQAIAANHKQLLELAPHLMQALADVPWKTTMFGKVVGTEQEQAAEADALALYMERVMAHCDRDIVVDVFFNVGIKISDFFGDMTVKNQDYLEKAVAQATAVLEGVWQLRKSAGIIGIGNGLSDLKTSHAQERKALDELLAREGELLAFLAKPFQTEMEISTTNLGRLRSRLEESNNDDEGFLHSLDEESTVESEVLLWTATRDSCRQFLLDLQCQFAELTLTHVSAVYDQAASEVHTVTKGGGSVAGQPVDLALVAEHTEWTQETRLWRLAAKKKLHSLLVKRATMHRDTVRSELQPLSEAYTESLPLRAGVEDEELRELKEAVEAAEREYKQAMEALFGLRYTKLNDDIERATAAMDDYSNGRAGPAQARETVAKLKQKLSKLRVFDNAEKQKLQRAAEEREAREYRRSQATKASRKKRETATRDTASKARAARALAAARYRIRAPLCGEDEGPPPGGEEVGDGSVASPAKEAGARRRKAPTNESPGQRKARQRLQQAAKERRLQKTEAAAESAARLDKSRKVTLAAREESLGRIREYHVRERARQQERASAQLSQVAGNVEATKAEQARRLERQRVSLAHQYSHAPSRQPEPVVYTHAYAVGGNAADSKRKSPSMNSGGFGAIISERIRQSLVSDSEPESDGEEEWS